MPNYYNEFDPKAAAWLRELIRAELISPGEVDERSINEVEPGDLRGFTQCHFFAGIGGWSYALRLAGWPEDCPVWTGSCPCQPFSAAGKGLAQADERHLWPVFFNLIRECRPDTVFGEQVEGAVGKGWLDGVQRDMEGEGYACGSAVLGAHSLGAPHIRQRLYWVADSIRTGERGRDQRGSGTGREQMDQQENRANAPDQACNGCEDAVGGMADSRQSGLQRNMSGPGGIEPTTDTGECEQQLERHGEVGGLAHTESERDERTPGATREAECGSDGAMHGEPWGTSRTIYCRDNKHRRIPERSAIKPIFQWLAYGVPGRMVSGWDRFVRSIEEKVGQYADAKKERAEEVLRKMRNQTGAEVLRRCSGGHDAVQGSEVLLAALFQLEGELGGVFVGHSQSISAMEGEIVREMRECPSRTSDASCPPQERESERQPARELRNALRVLSQDGTLVEAQALLESMAGFPLAGKVPARVVRLRGYGNAIVPQVAAAFVGAFLGRDAAIAEMLQ